MKFTTILVATFSLVSLGAEANADPIFHVTDLGKSYSFQYDPGGEARFSTNSDGITTSFSGYVRSVTNSDGSATYVYDKSPVTVTLDPNYGNYAWNVLGVTTFKNGPFQAVTTAYTNNSMKWSSVGWITAGGSPIFDINDHGQVVGGLDTSARFTLPNMQNHEPIISDYVSDMLNSYIPKLPDSAWLTTAFSIDDHGRILAKGSNDHDYLLTPLELGPPQTVPEPTALLLAGIIGCWVGVRSLYQRLERGRTFRLGFRS